MGLAAFWPILVIFFPPVMATNIIKNLTIFEIFLTFLRGSQIFLFFDFLEIGNIFVDKKGANYELMAKSQFSLNSNGYFSLDTTLIFSDFSQSLSEM